MPRPELDYLDELALELRFAGMDGAQIGSVLEEARDHLAAADQPPEEVFGPAKEYAAALADSQRERLQPRPMSLTVGDLIANGLQFLGFLLGFRGAMIVLLREDAAVDLGPGHLAGAGLLMIGLVWPLWPAMRAYLARRTGFATPVVACVAVVAVFVAVMQWWDEPVLIALSPVPAIGLGAVLIAVCWVRAWRLRDPVQRPSATAGTDHTS
ncbi:MAG: hypothetical protein JJT89_07430 [Nitriliruptoraceae bacterium]|nr:hypothetical protein [Nitriliruptoraceae bacterium]